MICNLQVFNQKIKIIIKNPFKTKQNNIINIYTQSTLTKNQLAWYLVKEEVLVI